MVATIVVRWLSPQNGHRQARKLPSRGRIDLDNVQMVVATDRPALVGAIDPFVPPGREST